MCLTLKPARVRVSSNLDQLTNDKGQSEARHMGKKELLRLQVKHIARLVRGKTHVVKS